MHPPLENLTLDELVALSPFTKADVLSRNGLGKNAWTRCIQNPNSPAAKKVRAFLEGVLSRCTHSLEDVKAIRQFSDAMIDDPADVTRIVPFVPFDAEPAWDTKIPIYAVSNREIQSLWMTPEYFKIYEASQINFLKSGGSMQRIFLVGGEPSKKHVSDTIHVLLRHKQLGLDPKVYSRVTFRDRIAELGVTCHMFVIAGSETSYYQIYNKHGERVIIATSREWALKKSQEVFQAMWKTAMEPEEWIRKQDVVMPDDDVINAEVDEIQKLAKL